MQLKSTGQYVVDSGLTNEVGHKGVFIPTIHKDKFRPQNHLQFVKSENLCEGKEEELES